MPDAAPVSEEQVSAEDAQGRVLSGVGVTKESLEAVIEAADRTPEPAAETPAATSATPEPPKAEPRGRRRIDALTFERKAAEERASAAEQRAKDLEAQLQALKTAPAMPPSAPSGVPASQQGTERTAPATGAPLARQKPSEEQVGTVYQSYADFVEDLADWKAEQRLAALDLDARIGQRLEADRATRTLQDRLVASQQTFKQQHPDFETVLNAPHMTEPWPAEKLAVIRDTDQPAAIQYALAKDPTLAAQLRSEPNLATFAVKLGQLLATAAVGTPAATAPSISVQVAPPPYQPVGAGSKTTPLSPTEMIKRAGYDYDSSGMREYFASQRGGRRMK